MKNSSFHSFSLLLLAISIVACTTKEIALDVNNESTTTEYSFVPINEALLRLNDFLNETQMLKTRSGDERSYSSVVPHYSENESSPDAYLVNFDNDEGFAILGANSRIAPIIAVVEKGNTDWDKLLPSQSGYEERLQSYSFYDENDPDVLGPGIPADQLITLCVRGALYGEDTSPMNETKSGPYTTEVLPLLGFDYDFGQNVTYCHKSNNKFVTNGCASTAIAMIFAYNRCPRMVVDTHYLSLSDCNSFDGQGYEYIFSDDVIYIKPEDYFTNSGSIPSNLSYNEKLELLTKIDPTVTSNHNLQFIYANKQYYRRTRYQLTSGIFYTLSNIIQNWNGTGTMPGAVVNGLTDMGYTYVSKTQDDYLNSDQIATIITMLTANKPVLMCGWSFWSLGQSHYWVVDGIRQNSSETLIHCNWGWEGSNNGWFASDCIRKDSPVASKSSGNGNGWANLIVFSYNKNYSAVNTIREFYDNHRVTY